jgi:hypothetical protein
MRRSAKARETPPPQTPSCASIGRRFKLGQANPNKIPWICLVLFVRIGTYQWVTAIPNKNFPPRLRFIAKEASISTLAKM